MIGIRVGETYRRFTAGILPFDWFYHVRDKGPMPLLIVLHDERSNVKRLLDSTFGKQFVGPNAATDSRVNSLTGLLGGELFGVTPHKLAVAFPQGSSLGAAPVVGGATEELCDWNSGHRGFAARTLGSDDVAFIDAMIGKLVEVHERAFEDLGGKPGTTVIDTRQIFAIGIGNGGMMCHRLACELPSTGNGFHLAGFCSIGGTIGGWASFEDFDLGRVGWVNDPNNPARPVPPNPLHVLLVHSTLDENVSPLIGSLDAQQRSETEVTRLIAELGSTMIPLLVTEAAAEALAPVDVGLNGSTEAWIQLVAAGAPVGVFPAAIVRDGVTLQRVRTTSRSGHSVTTLTADLDLPYLEWPVQAEVFLGDPYKPRMDLARLIWGFFSDPGSL